jgi:NADPH:quinone reductase-like Zn-dependent oxidoreductase
MKAIVYTKYGPPDVLEVQEVQNPSPKDNEVLVRVHASSVNALEWRRFTMALTAFRIFGGGLRQPKDKFLGVDLAGRVEAVGANAKQFRAGDEVFGIRRGSFAEFVCAPETLLAAKPTNLTFEAAAAVPLAALTALQGLRDQGKIQPGQKVLINGAGGGVGTFAVQIAKSLGTEVTAVCSTRNVDVARSIGADYVIDYTKEDFTQSGVQYDLIIGANGYHPLLHYRRALKPNGRYVVLGGSMGQIFQGMLLAPIVSWFGKKKMRGLMTQPNQKDLIFLKELLESRKIVPVVDRTYPLEKTADAIRYLLEGHPRGKVVITIRSPL